MTLPASRHATTLALVAVLLCAEALLLSQAIDVNAHVDALGEAGASAPLAGDGPRRILPAEAGLDGQEWIRLTIDLATRGEWRLRRCAWENAPFGREVYWSSGLTWWIRSLAAVHRGLTGSSLAASIERVATWSGPLLLMILLPIAAVIVHRRHGLVASVPLAAFVAGDRAFVAGFLPAVVDHHGMITAACAVTVAGLVLAADASSPRTRRRGLLASALGGAVAMWISAVSTSILLAVIGAAALAATWFARRHASSLLEPADWATWGRVGGAASLAFYLAEQFPDRLGMRLEVNHPLHALAWLGGGELLALAAGWDGGSRGGRRLARLVAALVALAALPVAALVGGARWSAMRDPLLRDLVTHIVEFEPLRLASLRGAHLVGVIGWGAIGALAVTQILSRRVPLGLRLGLVVASIPVAVLVALAMLQSRWLGVAAAPMAALVVTIGPALRARSERHAALLGVLLVALFLGQGFATTLAARADAKAPAGSISRAEAVALLERDAARTIADDAGGRPVTLLASPNSTLRMGYFAGFDGLGTLYWENLDGLRAAAEIWSASPETALALVQARGVTHVAATNTQHFLDEFESLARRDPGGSAAAHGEAFGRSLMVEGRVPPWLQPIPHPIRPAFRAAGLDVRLYRVAPYQTESDAWFHLGRYHQARGELDAAEAAYRRVLALAPSDGEATLRLGMLLAVGGHTEEGVALVVRALRAEPAARRRARLEEALRVLRQSGAEAAALALEGESAMLDRD